MWMSSAYLVFTPLFAALSTFIFVFQIRAQYGVHVEYGTCKLNGRGTAGVTRV